MKKFVIQFLIAIVICLTGMYFWQNKKIEDSKVEIQTLQKAADKVPVYESAIKRLEAANAEIEKKTEELKKQMVEKENTIAALQNDLAEEIAQSQQAGASEEEDQEGGKNLMSNIADMLENPDMRDAIRGQIKIAQVNPIYGSLIKKLKLSADKEEALSDLITDRFLTGTDAIKSLNSADESARKATLDNIKKQKEEINEQIKELLGEEAYKEYEKYSESEGERMIVGQFAQQLSYSGTLPLNESQNENLVQILKEENEAAKKDPNYKDMEGMSPSEYDDDTISDILFRQIDINKKVRDRAQKVLSADQLKGLERYQENFIKQLEMGLKMSKQMFGGSKKSQN